MVLIIQMENLRHREANWFAQGHTASQWRGCDFWLTIKCLARQAIQHFPLGRNNPLIFIKVQLQAAKFLGAKLHTTVSHHSIGTLSIYTEMSYWAARLLIKIEKKIDLKMALWNVWVCAAKSSHYPSQLSSRIKTCKFRYQILMIINVLKHFKDDKTKALARS